MSSDPPPPPDYIGAAKQQGANNLETTVAQAKLNNPNVTSPYGTQTVSYGNFDQPGFDAATQKYQTDLAAWNAQPAGLPAHWVTSRGRGGDSNEQWVPATGIAKGDTPTAPTREQFTVNPYTPNLTQSLTPAGQILLTKSQETRGMLADLAQQGTRAAQGIVGAPVDYSGAPPISGDLNALRDRSIAAAMSRVNEDTTRQRDDLNSNLVAAGIRPGSQAYDNQMNLVNRQYNDARNQAFLGSGQEVSRQTQLQQMARNQYLQEYQAKRQTPLNEITALMSGSQVNNPFQVPGYGQSGQAAPAPIYSATNAQGQYATDVFNQQAAQQANTNTGLIGLGTIATTAGIAI